MNLINTRLTWLHLLTWFYYSLSHLSFLMFGFLGSDCANYCLGPTDAWKCCASEVLVSSASYYSSCGGCGVDGMCNLCNNEAYKLNSLKTFCIYKALPKGDACKSDLSCAENKCSGSLEENPSDKLHCCDSTVNKYSCDGCGSDGMW
jgi:hypothetical protein